jgi:hypothetical protein
LRWFVRALALGNSGPDWPQRKRVFSKAFGKVFLIGHVDFNILFDAFPQSPVLDNEYPFKSFTCHVIIYRGSELDSLSEVSTIQACMRANLHIHEVRDSSPWIIAPEAFIHEVILERIFMFDLFQD